MIKNESYLLNVKIEIFEEVFSKFINFKDLRKAQIMVL